MIDLDISLLYQMGNFIVSILLLNLLIVKPIREVIRVRNEKMNSQAASIEGYTRSAESKLAEYSAALDAARRSGVETRNSMRDEALASEKSALEKAGEDAAATLGKARAAITAQVASARAALKPEVDKLATKAVAKILG